MKRFASVTLSLFICICLLLATERQAKAYVDPGTGLLALQSAASAVAAAAFLLRKRIVGFFTRKKSSAGIALPTTGRKNLS